MEGWRRRSARNRGKEGKGEREQEEKVVKKRRKYEDKNIVKKDEGNKSGEQKAKKELFF